MKKSVRAYNSCNSNFPYTTVRNNRMFAESASQWCATIDRGSYQHCGFANEHCQPAEYQCQYIEDEMLDETRVYRRHQCFASFKVCSNLTPKNCIRFKNCCQMKQLNEWHFQIGLIKIRKKIPNDCLVSYGKTRLICYCIEQLTQTVEYEQRRTHKHTQRNPYAHHMLLLKVVLPRK